MWTEIFRQAHLDSKSTESYIIAEAERRLKKKESQFEISSHLITLEWVSHFSQPYINEKCPQWAEWCPSWLLWVDGTQSSWRRASSTKWAPTSGLLFLLSKLLVSFQEVFFSSQGEPSAFVEAKKEWYWARLRASKLKGKLSGRLSLWMAKSLERTIWQVLSLSRR